MSDQKEESYPMKEMDKTEAEPETTEKSPLKGPDAEGGDKEAGANGKEKEEAKADGLNSILAQPRLKLLVLIGLALFLVVISLLILVIAILTSGDQWPEDRTPRMLKLIPTPNGPRNQISFRSGHGAEGRDWPKLTAEIKQLYEDYGPKMLLERKNITSCETSKPAPDQMVCYFNTDPIRHHCSPRDDFGYPDGSPCVFLQFNRVYNWTPEVYSKEDLESLDLPEELRQNYKGTGPYVECKGNTDVDRENAGEIILVPNNELPLKFFPYLRHPDYMSPFLAVKFKKPTTGIVIGVTCTLWAKNLGNDTVEGQWPSVALPFNLYVE